MKPCFASAEQIARDPTKSLRLQSGDVVMFGGPARLAYHGIDRVLPSTSTLIPGGGRINLTLRRVRGCGHKKCPQAAANAQRRIRPKKCGGDSETR